MITLLLVKNESGFQVFEKEHRDLPLRVMLFLRIVPCAFMMIFSLSLLYCSGNYSIKLYKACVDNRIGDLVLRHRWREITSLIKRYEVESLPHHQADIIYKNCNISIDQLLDQNFSIGQFCRLRFPMSEITKLLEWKKMKVYVKKLLKKKIQGLDVEQRAATFRNPASTPGIKNLMQATSAQDTREARSPKIELAMQTVALSDHESSTKDKKKEKNKVLESILNDTPEGVTKDRDADPYFLWTGQNAPFYRIVNFILKHEGKTEEDVCTPNWQVPDMVKLLTDHKLNVFLWQMCHKKDAAIDVKEYREYNPETDDFKLFDLEVVETLFHHHDDSEIFANNKQDKRMNRKQDFEDIHVFVKWRTRPNLQPHQVEIDGERFPTLDDDAGFFIYKDIREKKTPRHDFLTPSPPTLFENISATMKDQLRQDMMNKDEKKIQTPIIENLTKQQLDPNLTTGELLTSPSEMIVEQLLKDQPDKERGFRLGWTIVKIDNIIVSEDNFQEEWDRLQKDQQFTATFQYNQPGTFQCARCCSCLENVNARLDNAQTGVTANLKPGDFVRFRGLPDELRDAYDERRTGKLLKIQEHENMRRQVLQNAKDISEDLKESMRVWNLELIEDGNFIGKRDMPEIWLAPLHTKYGENQYSVELTTGSWEFDVDKYDWTLIQKVNENGDSVSSDTLEANNIKEGFSVDYIQVGEKKYYTNDSDSQGKIMALLNSENIDETLTIKFLPPEEKGFSDYACSACWSLCCCVPCAWLSFRPYCGRGGQKYSAKELITTQVTNEDNKREYLVDDGDIFLSAYANPGWLSLAQGGQWGHCGIIYRYKEKTLEFLPDRFQKQLKNWKLRGIVQEGTPLVFEMANHGREGDTNEYQVHLSHLQNWHMFHDARKYFGPSIGIRKFTGKRNANFYSALFKTMHRHHMKPYESVPLEFICAGLCFFPKTTYAKSVEQLFCSELVALFFYHLDYEDEDGETRSLIPAHVYPSEFIPSDWGEQKSAMPFCFMCCCCFSYMNCFEQRNVYTYTLGQYMGPLYILDINSIDEWEDEVKSKRQLEEVEKKQRQREHFSSAPIEIHARSPSFRLLFSGNSTRGVDYRNDDNCDIHEAVKREHLRRLRQEQKGLSIGGMLVELTWWFFFLVTFPAGIYIRVRYHLVAVDATSERHKQDKSENEIRDDISYVSTEEEFGNEESEKKDACCGRCKWREYLILAVGVIYAAVWCIIFRVLFGWDSLSLMEFPLYVYFFGIIFLGLELVCGRGTRQCYDAFFRLGFRAFGVRLKDSQYISTQMGPIKIPFITVITLSFALIGGFTVDYLGYQREGADFEYRKPTDYLVFFGSLAGLIVIMYILCRYVIKSAIQKFPDILDQITFKSRYKKQEFENDLVDFLQNEDRIRERRENARPEAGIRELTLELQDYEDEVKEIEDKINFLDEHNEQNAPIELDAMKRIMNIIMDREKKALKKDLGIANYELQQTRIAIDKAQRSKSHRFPTWFRNLGLKDRNTFEKHFETSYENFHKGGGPHFDPKDAEYLKNKYNITIQKLDALWGILRREREKFDDDDSDLPQADNNLFPRSLDPQDSGISVRRDPGLDFDPRGHQPLH